MGVPWSSKGKESTKTLTFSARRYDSSGVCTGVSCVCQDVTLRSATLARQEQLSAQISQVLFPFPPPLSAVNPLLTPL